MSHVQTSAREHQDGQHAEEAKQSAIALLDQAEDAIRSLKSSYESRDEEIADLKAALQRAQRSHKRLEGKVSDLKDEIERERARAERQKERADQLATHLKEIHRSLFSGNLYSLILKACITLSGGTRGLYVTSRTSHGGKRTFTVRASEDIDGYPGSRLSGFLHALCEKALENNETVLCTQEDLKGLPQPRKESEKFHNCVVTPVVLLRNMDGVIIVADKASGDFDAEDVETLLAVGNQAAVTVENARLHEELQEAYLATVGLLADAVEAKDPYTHGHCEMVSRYCRLTAEKLGMNDGDMSVLCYAGLLHDVGKIAVSDGILNKPGPLSPEERELMRSHVRIGYELVSRVSVLKPVAHVVLHHHEWFDGSGYPEGLQGVDIPKAARILCVVDAYCAMMTKRSYKEAYTDERARAELRRCAGSQFDPEVVEAFLEVLDMPDVRAFDDDEQIECGLFPALERHHGAHK